MWTLVLFWGHGRERRRSREPQDNWTRETPPYICERGRGNTGTITSPITPYTSGILSHPIPQRTLSNTYTPGILSNTNTSGILSNTRSHYAHTTPEYYQTCRTTHTTPTLHTHTYTPHHNTTLMPHPSTSSCN